MSDSQPASENRAVFLSYASQDAEAALRICGALRIAGVEVWFDQSELVGGDAWDQKIRVQIASCALFVPVISANTQARREGYFRIEWKLAVQRTHAMADGTPFLLPVVIDATRDIEALVPAEFKAVQWTRLPVRPAQGSEPVEESGGETPEKFCASVKRLLRGDAVGAVGAVGAVVDRVPGQRLGRRQPSEPSRRRLVLTILGAGMLVVLALWQPWKEAATTRPTAPSVSEAQQLVAEVWAEVERIHLDPPLLTAAEGLARRAAALEPLNPDVWAAWSQVDSWFGYMQYDTTPQRIESARANAEHALRLAPKSFEARLAQAVYLVRAHGEVTLPPNPEQAEALLNELLKERPEDARTLLTAAIFERNLRHWPEARMLFQRLARNPPFAAQAFAELGYMEQRAGDSVAAEAAADRSIQLQPYATNLTLKLYLATDRGDLDAAEATLDRLPSDLTEEDKVVSIAAQIEWMRRDPMRMLKRLEPITREWLSSVDYDGPTGFWTGAARQLAGETDAAKYQWELALNQVERRLENNSSSGALIKWKGVLLALLGRNAESEKLLKLASEMNVGANEGPPGSAWVQAKMLNGQADAVVALFEARHKRAFALRSGFFRLDPFYDSLRANPRFQSLLEKWSKETDAQSVVPVLSSAADEKSVHQAEKPVVK